MVRAIAASESIPVADRPSPRRTMREKASMTRKPRPAPRATRRRQLLVPRSSAAYVSRKPDPAPSTAGASGGGSGPDEAGGGERPFCKARRNPWRDNDKFGDRSHATAGRAGCEAGPSRAPPPLPERPALCYLGEPDARVGGSSNGRTADSDSASLGSNPSPPASFFSKTCERNRAGRCTSFAASSARV